MNSKVRTNLVFSYTTLLNLFVLLSCFIVSIVKAGRPIIYPYPSSTDLAFIHDHARDTLVQIPGGYSSFFCDSCPTDVSIYTSLRRMQVVASWIQDNGEIGRFPEDISIFISDEFQTRVNTSENRVSRIDMNVFLMEKSSVALLRIMSGSWSRTVRFVKDNKPPEVVITQISETDLNNRHEYRLRVDFGESVFWQRPVMNCTDIPLVSRNTSLSDVLSQSEGCTFNLLQNYISNGIIVDGAEILSTVISNDDSHVHLVVATPTQNQPHDVLVTLSEGYADFAGNEVLERPELRLYYRPIIGMPSQMRRDRVKKRIIKLSNPPSYAGARAMGRATTLAVAGSCATSLATSAGSGSSGGSVTLINNVQKMHMTGLLAVTKMPDGYKNFTHEVGWAVLDIDVPWKGSKSNKTNNGTSEARNPNQRSLKVVEASLEAGDDEDEFDYFERIMFWVPVIFFAVVFIHLVLLLVFFLKQWQLPDILQPPRVELMLAFLLLPPIAIAAAGLYQGSKSEAFLATWMIIAFPVSFLTWNFFMLWFYILRLPPHLRQANQITDLPSRKQKALKKLKSVLLVKMAATSFGSMASRQSRGSRADSKVELMSRPNSSDSGPTHHAPIDRRDTLYDFDEEHNSMNGEQENKEAEALTCGEIIEILSNMNWITLLFGEHQEEADWSSTLYQGSKFVARYGPLFEEYRGPAIGRKDATLDVDPVTRRVDRGTLVIIKERALIQICKLGQKGSFFYFPGKKIYRYHLQIVAKLLDISKTILVGCIVAGVGNEEDNIGSIIALIALSLAVLFLFRIAKPFPSRLDMFLLLLVEVADLIVYTCALFILLGPETTQETYDNVALALILSEGFALIAMIIEYTLISIGLGFLAWETWEDSYKVKFFNVVYECMVKDGKYLEKKYFDKWMVKTFKRGLHGREPRRHELPWKYTLKLYLAYIMQGFYWLVYEVKEVISDTSKKTKFTS